jgi:hypothetical protein
VDLSKKFAEKNENNKKIKNFETHQSVGAIGEGFGLVETAVAGLGVGRVAQVVEAAVVVTSSYGSVLHHVLVMTSLFFWFC